MSQDSPARINVAIVDDHTLVRDMLCAHLKRDQRINVVCSAASADECISAAASHRPDVVLMDVDMPGVSCFEAARKIKGLLPRTRIVFLTAHVVDRYIDQALAVGAMGYLTKNEPPEDVVNAIYEVSQNRACFSGEVRSRIAVGTDRVRLAKVDATSRSRSSTLTPREREVLQYIAKGLAKKEIAALMRVTVKTVEKHSFNLMKKLDIHDRVQLTRFAIREGLARP